MERKEISRNIGGILDDITRLGNTLYAMDTTDIQRYPDNYVILSTDAALHGEKIACRLRRLLYGSTTVKKPEYLASAGNALGITIQNQGGVMEITLPCLLPKRKERQGTEFLIDPLHFTLSRYAETHQMPRFSHCVVCFSHIYDQELPTRRVHDYDNLELKQVLDVVSSYLLEDDGGLLVDAYNTTELGDTDCTRVSVMDKDRFPAWLAEQEKRLKSISDF